MSKKCFTARNAPKALGPYSHAVIAGGFVFLSGQIGMDPASSSMVSGGIEAETRQALANILAILEELGLGSEDVVKTTVFLRDLGDFSRMNAVYASVFSRNPPARSTVEISDMAGSALVEIEATACMLAGE
jgi:2-iminobutanoate/2-iminopropanoate deaminase